MTFTKESLENFIESNGIRSFDYLVFVSATAPSKETSVLSIIKVNNPENLLDQLYRHITDTVSDGDIIENDGRLEIVGNCNYFSEPTKFILLGYGEIIEI